MIHVVQKVCNKCNKSKLAEFFYKDKTKSDGLRNACKECEKKNRKKFDPSNITNKTCCVCKKALPVSNFDKDTRVKDGFRRHCKACRPTIDKERQEKKEKENPQPLVERKLCIGCSQVKPASEFKINAKSSDNLTYKCIVCLPKNNWTVEKQRESDRKYREYNKDKLQLKWKKQAENINRRVRSNLGHRIIEVMNASKVRKDNSTLFYTGCDIMFLRSWIEYQFDERMTWDNYGEWEIDHVKPCCSYDLSVVEQQYKCFNWKNLQPLWRIDNITKSGKIDYSMIKSHRKKAYQFELNYSAQVKECELLEQP